MSQAEGEKALQDILHKVKAAGATDARIQPRYRTMFDGLKKAIAAHSADEIELFQDELQKVIAGIDRCQRDIQEALGLLARLRRDDALMQSRFAVVSKLIEQLVGMRDRLADQAKAARKLYDDASNADAAAKKDARSAEVELDALKAEAAAMTKIVEAADREMKPTGDAARAANERNDKNALTSARLKVNAWYQLEVPARGLRARLDDYRKEHPDIDNSMKSELRDCIDEADDAVDMARRAFALMDELMKLKPPPRITQTSTQVPFSKAEIHKAAVAVNVPAGDEAKLGKILNDLVRDKWAAALGKLAVQLKLPAPDGREMLKKLDKLDFIRRGHLIELTTTTSRG